VRARRSPIRWLGAIDLQAGIDRSAGRRERALLADPVAGSERSICRPQGARTPLA
jgi:hypothetical protein